MTIPAATAPKSSLTSRFAAFVTERHPFAARAAIRALEHAREEKRSADAEGLRDALRRALEPALTVTLAVGDVPETTPGISGDARLRQAIDEVVDDCDGFLR